MPFCHEIVQLNTAATEYVADPTTSFDSTVAALILRNAAMAADHVSVEHFVGLSPDTRNAYLDAAGLAREIAPLDPRSEQRRPYESDAEYAYRRQIWQPLHNLQVNINIADLRPNGETEQDRMRQAVRLAGTAFSGIVQEASAHSDLKGLIKLFHTNALAAAARVERLRREQLL